MANSSQLVLPMMIPPAASIRVDGRRVVRRDKILEQLRPAGGADALGEDDVFHRDRHAGERAGLLAMRDLLIHRPRAAAMARSGERWR